MTGKKRCNTKLVVECYGGGLRYYCPHCDLRHNGHTPVVIWTNAAPPANRKCRRSRSCCW